MGVTTPVLAEHQGKYIFNFLKLHKQNHIIHEGNKEEDVLLTMLLP
jgi:hypothetical protein